MDADVVGTTLFEGIGSIENSDWSETDLSKCKFMYYYLHHLLASSLPFVSLTLFPIPLVNAHRSGSIDSYMTLTTIY
jgi:hypothetical protein